MACNSTSILPSSRREPKKPPAMTSAVAGSPMTFCMGGKTMTSLALPAVTQASPSGQESARDWLDPSRPAYSSVINTVLMPARSAFQQFMIRSASGLPKPSSEITRPSTPSIRASFTA